MTINRSTCRWIAFDAVGTLIHPEPSVARAYHAVAVKHGSRLPVDEIAQRFRKAFRDSEQADDGHVTSEEIERERWRFLVRSVLDDVEDGEACFEDLFQYFARPEAWRCFPDVRDTLARLREAGHQLAIASNFDGRLHTLCDGLPDLSPIHVRIASSELGVRKPSPRFFTELARRLDCPPGQILMVGDDYENDVVAARAAGLSAVLLCRQSPGQGITSLAELLKSTPGE